MAVNQGKINDMVATTNKNFSTYITNFEANIKKIEADFKEKWASQSASELAQELSDCLDSFSTLVKDYFDNKSTAIGTNLQNESQVENVTIDWPGFTVEKPDTHLLVDKSFPNGDVGLKDGETLESITKLVNDLADSIGTDLNTLSNGFSESTGLNTNEANTLNETIQNMIHQLKHDKFEQIRASLEERIKEEIALREEKERVNIQNIKDNI